MAYASGDQHWNWRGGVKRHPLYKTWDNMMNRCLNENDWNYPNWGGRGITVSDEFKDSVTFLNYIDETLGPRPDGCSLDRIDNDKGYVRGNLRWATHSEQARNRRSWKREKKQSVQQS